MQVGLLPAIPILHIVPDLICPEITMIALYQLLDLDIVSLIIFHVRLSHLYNICFPGTLDLSFQVGA
jgi:hypothetical protein